MVTDFLSLDISGLFTHCDRLGILPWHMKLHSNLITQTVVPTFHQFARGFYQDSWKLHLQRNDVKESGLYLISSWDSLVSHDCETLFCLVHYYSSYLLY